MIQHGLIGEIRRRVTGPVSRITVHHEGAGVPTDIARGAEGGYSVWIGTAFWTGLRSPYVSFGTRRYNHRSLDICLSGNRELWYVSDRDVRLISDAVADYRARGWVSADPVVVAHHNSPGSNTVCPGDRTFDQWSRIVAACHGLLPSTRPSVPQPKDEDVFVIHDEIHTGLDANHPRVAAVDPAHNGQILLGNGANIGHAPRMWNGLTVVDPGYQPGEKYVGAFYRRDEHDRIIGWTQMSIFPSGQWATRDYYFHR